MKLPVVLNRWASANLSYAGLSSAVAFRIGTIIFTVMETPSARSVMTTESDVAEAVYRAANDASGQLRFPGRRGGAGSVEIRERGARRSPAHARRQDAVRAREELARARGVPRREAREQLLCEFPRVPRERRSRQSQEV